MHTITFYKNYFEGNETSLAICTALARYAYISNTITYIISAHTYVLIIQSSYDPGIVRYYEIVKNAGCSHDIIRKILRKLYMHIYIYYIYDRIIAIETIPGS